MTATCLVSFYWAAAQFLPYNGAMTGSWQVTFGGDTRSKPVVALVSHGLTPWTQQTSGFAATAASQVLSFLAVGTPDATPPSSSLDGVSLAAAPEPASAMLVLVGPLGFAAVTWHGGRRSAIRRLRGPAGLKEAGRSVFSSLAVPVSRSA